MLHVINHSLRWPMPTQQPAVMFVSAGKHWDLEGQLKPFLSPMSPPGGWRRCHEQSSTVNNIKIILAYSVKERNVTSQTSYMEEAIAGRCVDLWYIYLVGHVQSLEGPCRETSLRSQLMVLLPCPESFINIELCKQGAHLVSMVSQLHLTNQGSSCPESRHICISL